MVEQIEIENSKINEGPEEELASTSNKTKKELKKGIIYLSTIPPYMNVTKIRELLGVYGTIGRIYLQLNNYGKDTKDKTGDKKKQRRQVAKKFTEGWVEFERKSVAKKVAQLLNNNQVSSRKKSKQYDCIWNIKYLSNFKWTHLHERLAYERAARKQKLLAEINLAKKKTNFFSSNLNKKKNGKTTVPMETNENQITEETATTTDTSNREEFLTSLFS